MNLITNPMFGNRSANIRYIVFALAAAAALAVQAVRYGSADKNNGVPPVPERPAVTNCIPASDASCPH